MNPPAATAALPGIVSGLMAFIGGPRACIGYKFALIECVPRKQGCAADVRRIKCLLFHLLRGVRFELAFPVEQLYVKSAALNQPTIRGDERVQMPLIVSAL